MAYPNSLNIFHALQTCKSGKPMMIEEREVYIYYILKYINDRSRYSNKKERKPETDSAYEREKKASIWKKLEAKFLK